MDTQGSKRFIEVASPAHLRSKPDDDAEEDNEDEDEEASPAALQATARTLRQVRAGRLLLKHSLLCLQSRSGGIEAWHCSTYTNACNFAAILPLLLVVECRFLAGS